MEKFVFKRRIVLLVSAVLLLPIFALPIFEIILRIDIAPFFEIVKQDINYFGIQFDLVYFFEFFAVIFFIFVYLLGNILNIAHKLIKEDRQVKKDQRTHKDYDRNKTWP